MATRQLYFKNALSQSTLDALLRLGISRDVAGPIARDYGGNLRGALNQIFHGTNGWREDVPLRSRYNIDKSDNPRLVRPTKLSITFMCGYTRSHYQYIPGEIQLLISRYVNYYFVRLKYDTHNNMDMLIENSLQSQVTSPEYKMEKKPENWRQRGAALLTQNFKKFKDCIKRKSDTGHISTDYIDYLAPHWYTSVLAYDPLCDDLTLRSVARFLERNGPFQYCYDALSRDALYGKNTDTFDLTPPDKFEEMVKDKERRDIEMKTHALFVRLWMHFKYTRHLYCVKAADNKCKIGCDMDDILKYETEQSMDRWVEVPDHKLTMNMEQIDSRLMKLSEGDILADLEIGVEFYNQQQCKWPSWNVGQHAEVHSKCQRCQNEKCQGYWRQQLKVGDIVDVRDSTGKWYEAVIQKLIECDNCGRHIFVHYIGWATKWDEEVSVMDMERVQKRGTNTNGPYRRVNGFNDTTISRRCPHCGQTNCSGVVVRPVRRPRS